jgi:hypothetical protein
MTVGRGISRLAHSSRPCKEVVLMVALAIAFIVLIGPLAVLYGVDSRVDDRRGGWPNQRR